MCAIFTIFLDSSSDMSSNSSDSEDDSKKKKKKPTNSANNSRSGSPAQLDAKRKMTSMPTDLGMISENSNSPTATPAKRVKMDQPSLPISMSSVTSALSSRE